MCLIRLYIFFDKGNILISREYQLHSVFATTQCPKDIVDAHSQTQKRRRRKKDPAKQINALQQQHIHHHDSTRSPILLKKRRLQEGNSAPAPSSPDQRTQVFTLKIVRTLETMCSTVYCQEQPIKARPWIFTLKVKTLYSSCATGPACRCHCYKTRITKQILHHHEDSIHNYQPSDFRGHGLCLPHENRNTDMPQCQRENFTSHPPEF